MHRTAEYGISALEVQGGQGRRRRARGRLDEMGWLRQLLEWQREAQAPEEFLDTLRYELNSREVFVLSPKGDIFSLPAGSCPIDFAYAVHTEVGHRCVGARVNGIW
jgi:GTP pyrophosphokinase